MLNILFYRFGEFTCWVSRYDLYSTLPFASGRVANRRNSKLLLLIAPRQSQNPTHSTGRSTADSRIKQYTLEELKKLKGKTDGKRVEKKTDSDVEKAAPLVSDYDANKFKPRQLMRHKLGL